MHIAQIGTGRVGRPTAYTLMCSGIMEKLTVCDVKPGLAKAFAEELRHAAVSIGSNTEIISCEKDEDVAGADVILISAGEPRIPGVKMSRRDLAVQNGKIVKYISESTVTKNPHAKYVVITNPVDAMAMVCKKYSKADFVISTGTNLESLRFRAKLAQILKVPVSQVVGWVGGEHGDAAVPLWSTTRICGLPIDQYVLSKNIEFSKEEVATYVKTVSKLIVDNIGGTEFGPAASFRDIVKAIVCKTGEVFSIATPSSFPGNSEGAYVGVPVHLSSKIGVSLYDELLKSEQEAIKKAAIEIHQTFKVAVEALE